MQSDEWRTGAPQFLSEVSNIDKVCESCITSNARVALQSNARSALSSINNLVDTKH